MNVPLDVLHHDDRIVYHQTDREHNRKQGEKVDREAGNEHQEDGADE